MDAASNSPFVSRPAVVEDVFADKGYFFVVDLHDSESVFAHFKQWQGIGVPRVGDAVQYTRVRTKKGLRALTCGPEQAGGQP